MEIAQKLAALRNHLQKTAAGMVILRVFFQMGRQFIDLARSNGNLDLGRARVLVALLMFAHNAGFNALR